MKKIYLILACLFLIPVSATASTSDYNAFYFDVANSNLPNIHYVGGNLFGNGIGIDNLKLSVGNSEKLLSGVGMTLNFNLSAADAAGDWAWDSGSIMIMQGATKLLEANLNTVALKKVFSNTSGYIFSLGSVNSDYFTSTVDHSIDSALMFPDDTTYPTIMNLSFVVNSDINPQTPFDGIVYDGSVNGHQNPVPIPAAAWLFLTGIAGIAGLRRKNKK